MENRISRRRFLGRSVAALAGISLLPSVTSCQSEQAAPAAAPVNDGKPHSDFNGVHMGTITYSWRSMPGGMDNLISYCKQANVSNLELMGDDLENALGAPASPMMNIYMAAFARMSEAQRASVMSNPAGIASVFNADERKQMEDYNKAITEFRLGLDFGKVEEARQRFADEGIDIHIVKTQPSGMPTDELIDYAFRLAKAMGAKGVTDEMSVESAKKMAPFAEKHDMYYCMHNHMQYATPEYSAGPDEILAVSPNIMLNFDFGHYFGSTGKHPADFIRKYHDRIFSMHTKDKTGPDAPTPNENQVWGQGQTPLEDVLKLVQSDYNHIYCDVELEYEVAPWSNAVKETGTCIKYARQILM